MLLQHSIILTLTLFPAFASAQCARCITVYGDTRTDDASHRHVVSAIVQTNPVTVFHTGDMVENTSNPDEWRTFSDAIAPLRAKAEIFPVIGNHEAGNLNLYFSFFSLGQDKRWYTVTRAGIHFIVLNSFNPFNKGSEQYAWLENELKLAATSSEPAVILTHLPFYSSGYHEYFRAEDKGADAGPQYRSAAIRAALEPLFVRYGVKAVFSGHDHEYERSFRSGIHYIVTGGGGAPLGKKVALNQYSRFFRSTYHFMSLSVETGGQIFVEAITPDMKVMDSFTIGENRKRYNSERW